MQICTSHKLVIAEPCQQQGPTVQQATLYFAFLAERLVKRVPGGSDKFRACGLSDHHRTVHQKSGYSQVLEPEFLGRRIRLSNLDRPHQLNSRILI